MYLNHLLSRGMSIFVDHYHNKFTCRYTQIHIMYMNLSDTHGL